MIDKTFYILNWMIYDGLENPQCRCDKMIFYRHFGALQYFELNDWWCFGKSLMTMWRNDFYQKSSCCEDNYSIGRFAAVENPQCRGDEMFLPKNLPASMIIIV